MASLGYLLLRILGLFGGLIFIVSLLPDPPKPTAKEKKAEWTFRRAPEICVQQIREQLRDPDSYAVINEGVLFYEVMEDKEDGRHIEWSFRSKNGFGGYSIARARCMFTKEPDSVVMAVIAKE
jgi:hypothetical protein